MSDVDEDDIQESFFQTEKQSTIFLIDCSVNMPAQKITKVLECILEFSRQKILASDGDTVGLVFYGTQDQKNDMDFPNIYVQQTVDLFDIKRLLALEHLCTQFSLGQSTEYSLGQAFWICSLLFSAKFDGLI